LLLESTAARGRTVEETASLRKASWRKTFTASRAVTAPD
jgi:hypothetical protein